MKNNVTQVIETCVAWYQWGYDENGNPTEPHFLDWICHTYVIDIPNPPSGGTGSGNGAGGSSSGGGSTTTPPNEQPCIPKAVDVAKSGNLKVNLVQPPDGGFPPPTTPEPCPVKEDTEPVPTIKMDQLKKKYPCAVKLVINKLLQTSNFNKLAEPFITTKRPDLTYEYKNLTWNKKQAGETYTYQLGEESMDTTSATGMSRVVTLNDKMLANSSQLFITSAVIHETVHAYIGYSIATAVTNPGEVIDYGNWMLTINGYYIVKDLPPNYRDHYEMMRDHFNSSVNTLAQWDNNAHTNKDYVMTMLYGLNTADANCPPALKATLNKLYQEIITKNAITPAELEKFYKDNLNAKAADKLPTTGC